MGQIRVSIANLAWFLKLEGGSVRHSFGILNPKKFEKGERQYMALGGAAMLTKEGKRLLEQVVGATHFEFDKDTGFYDARFQIDRRDFNFVLRTFSQENIGRYEHDPNLDIVAELAGKEFRGYGTILTESEVSSVRISCEGVVLQKPPKIGNDTSTRASSEMPTQRLFRIYELTMPSEVFKKFRNSPTVRLLTEEELATTEGGSKAGRTSDGCVIQNNLFLV